MAAVCVVKQVNCSKCGVTARTHTTHYRDEVMQLRPPPHHLTELRQGAKKVWRHRKSEADEIEHAIN